MQIQKIDKTKFVREFNEITNSKIVDIKEYTDWFNVVTECSIVSALVIKRLSEHFEVEFMNVSFQDTRIKCNYSNNNKIPDLWSNFKLTRITISFHYAELVN